MKISKKKATEILRKEAAKADDGTVDPKWVWRIERLSDACKGRGKARTHIAFLGTAILAKAVDLDVDVFAAKAKNPVPGKAPPPNAYSARTLCHGVLVPVATELGISIGVTGREPLNNQPYFRIIRIGDNTPIHANAREAFEIVKEVLADLDKVVSEDEARAALRSFIHVRRSVQPNYADMVDGVALTVDQLVTLIETFVASDSEGGKRAQAVVAGLLAVYAGSGLVDAGRINDPSRHYPGDVVVRSMNENDESEEEGPITKSFEVRDKPVAVSDVLIFGQKALTDGVREAAVVAVSPAQGELDLAKIAAWANERMMGLNVFFGWREFVRQVLFWSPQQGPLAAGEAVTTIHERLIDAEVSEGGVNWWAAQAEALIT